MDTNSIIAFLACIIVIFLIGKIFIVPIKKIGKILLNSVLGGVLIYVINLVGGAFSFHIGLNIGTSIFIRTAWNSRSSCFGDIETYDVRQLGPG